MRLFPPLRKSWAKRGEQAVVEISGRNAKRVVFGALQLKTGQRIFLTRRRQTATDFGQFLLLLRKVQPLGPMAVLLDEHSSHTAADTLRLAEQLDIHLIFLPPRSPHLNPVDHLWRAGKQAITANRQDQDVDHLALTFLSYLSELPPKEALRKAGVLSSHFWLKRAVLS